MDEITIVLRDVERFLTQVLGKLGNLPDEVNKERLELSQRLQKFLISPEKEASKKKPPLPAPVEPVGEEFDEVDDGQETYDDVVKDDGGDETYDDVAGQNQATEVQENYDDVVALKPTGKTTTDGNGAKPEESNSEPEELYDDVESRVSKSSNSSGSGTSLEAKNVAALRKVADFTDRIYEGFLDKYRTKGFMKGFASKWQHRYCVLTPLALYYYESKDKTQKGQIILPAGDHTLRKGSPSFPEVKDNKLCFELGNDDRCFLFKASKESELIVWLKHIEAALKTDLSDEQSRIMRQNSVKMNLHDDDDDGDDADGEDLYEAVDNYKKPPSNSNDAGPINEEMYELTDQFSQVKETPGPSVEAPALPSRNKAPSVVPRASETQEEEEFEKVDDEDFMQEYELPETNVPKPGSKAGKEEEKPPPVVSRQNPQQSKGSPTLPARPNSSTQEAPHLPPRGGAKPSPGPQKPPELPTRTTPPSAKKTPPELPTRTTPTLTKKNQNSTTDDPEPSPPQTPAEPAVQTESKTEVAASPPVKAKPLKGEKFDYAKVYVAMWNCTGDDEDDLTFSRGNYLYIREKIPNSDWWVASLMDIPDIRVGLVPRNYIMPAYEM